MEPFITPIIVVLAIIQFIMIIVFFVMANNISAIRKRISPNKEEFKSKFYSLILLGDTEKAKLLLFEHISKEEDFIYAVNYRSEHRINRAQTALNIQYKNELKALNINEFDLSFLLLTQKEE